ncbi:metal ABC transporter ATP-binding protein [Paenibacillus glycanilyticus]|uniref:metal ABC transporter ATP-binding protein n=1 Tax=Paenibacillus glycanilyticus TaxID=126569 RepID=UPI00203C61F0|nr:metal ABC transporter ATP-binding protein [Paenibacillus glycanilyticus]MCM3628397.1 metal ABC transporter ATP-binding protein [Paenibacillus glycanilyticus]
MLLASLQDVTFGYGDAPCLERANIEVHSGEFIAVTGPNGASKSTLLKLALQLLTPWQGKVTLSQANSEGNKLLVAYVPQQIAAFNSGFPSQVTEFVRSGLYAQSGNWLRKLNSQAKKAADEAMQSMGIWELRNRRIGELSGGQKQRICIARALAMSPDLFVLDEPTTGMDKESRMSFYRLMRDQIDKLGKTVVIVTHNLTEMNDMLDRIITLERREEGGWKCCTTTSCSGHFAPVESLH